MTLTPVTAVLTLSTVAPVVMIVRDIGGPIRLKYIRGAVPTLTALVGTRRDP